MRPPIVWRADPASASDLVRAAVELDLAGFDAMVIPDGGRGAAEPLLVAAAAARRTSRLGLIVELSPLRQAPFLTARALSSLDALSHGRAGWAVQLEGVPAAGDVEGDDTGRWSPIGSSRDELLEAACDHVAAVLALWNSWEPGAIVADVDRGQYVDPSRVHTTDYIGPFVRSRGPLNAPRTPQGRPVLVALDASLPFADVRLVAAADAAWSGKTLREVGLDRPLDDLLDAHGGDGWCMRGPVTGADYGRLLHEVMPALGTALDAVLLRDRLGLAADDFDFRAVIPPAIEVAR